MSLYKVPLFQQPRGHVQVEQGATKGATIGLNVWNADGTLFVPAAASGSTSTPVVGSTLWELVLKIPANITGLAAVTTDGWFRKDAAAIAARELLGSDLPDLADSGTGAALVKITRDAKGRVDGTQAANLADLADVAATAPSDGQVLTYDTTNGWQPETPSGGGGGGGAMTLLGTATVAGSAATVLTLSGLDLSAYTSFHVIYSMANATASASQLSMYYNSDTTAANYESQTLTVNGSSITASRAADGRCFSLPVSGDSVGHFQITKGLTGRPRATIFMNRGDSNLLLQFNVHDWASATNVTEITISSAVASALAVGSYFKVYGVT